jgi:hypothetical protein
MKKRVVLESINSPLRRAGTTHILDLVQDEFETVRSLPNWNSHNRKVFSIEKYYTLARKDIEYRIAKLDLFRRT